MGYISGYDTIRGTDGTVILEADGQEFELIHLKNIEAKANINQDEVPRIGTRTVGHKVSTITFEGSATGYYGDPKMRRLFLDYLNTGRYPRLHMTVVNDDQDTHAREQRMILRNVMFTEQTLAKLDAESTSMEEEYSFTFERPILVDEFDDTPPEEGETI